RAQGCSSMAAIEGDGFGIVANADRHIVAGKGAFGAAALAAEKAMRDAGQRRQQGAGFKRRAHGAKPGGARPGLAAQNTLNSSPIWSGAVSRLRAAATSPAAPGLATLSALARSPMPRRSRNWP